MPENLPGQWLISSRLLCDDKCLPTLRGLRIVLNPPNNRYTFLRNLYIEYT